MDSHTVQTHGKLECPRESMVLKMAWQMELRSSHWVIINSPKDRLCIFPRKAGIFLSFFYIYVKEVKKEKQGHVRNFSGLYQVFIVESSSILSTWVEWFGFQLGDLILLSYSHCLQVCSANRSFSSFSDIWAYSKMLLKYICF